MQGLLGQAAGTGGEAGEIETTWVVDGSAEASQYPIGSVLERLEKLETSVAARETRTNRSRLVRMQWQLFVDDNTACDFTAAVHFNGGPG